MTDTDTNAVTAEMIEAGAEVARGTAKNWWDVETVHDYVRAIYLAMSSASLKAPSLVAGDVVEQLRRILAGDDDVPLFETIEAAIAALTNHPTAQTPGWFQDEEMRRYSSERQTEGLVELLSKFQWKSDKDNMEFTTTIPYTLMDKLRELTRASQEHEG